jgi:hypothetical protein
MADEAAPADSRLIDLEIEKRRLECEKLRAEIAEVGQPLWKRAGYIASLSPILLAAVAFFSAWVTGYFDRQRQDLATEVEALEVKRDELAARNAAIQEAIDDVYLRLKVVSGEAAYALSHLRGLDDGRDRVAELRALLQGDSNQVAQFVKEMSQRERFIDEIVLITEEELRKMRTGLEEVPASGWARELLYQPGPEGEVLTAPDGRRYHLREKRFLDPSGQEPGGGTADRAAGAGGSGAD